jgi:hypothetical protein
MQAGRNNREEDARPKSAPPPAVLVTLIAAICAGLAGTVASGLMAWIAIAAAALGGAYFASRTAGGSAPSASDTMRARRLLLLLDRGGSPDAKMPPDFTDEWAQLFEKVNQLALQAHNTPTAVAQLEQFRKQAELAAELLRHGKDPLVESPELRAGPLLPLLEGVKGSTSLPVVSHLRLGEEEELIGAGGDALPPDWPLPSGERGNADLSAIESGLHGLMGEIESLRGTLAGGANGESSRGADDPSLRTPAQLVDAVVLTAADGIEDLAAGLMRANELASVAERVTNRATLLALNAALEATRSGSEAFAAIAEETRRLAEFAREATDTIARLSSEIEYKVGETITAIHATSEDAKTSLAEMGGTPLPANSSARTARVQVVRLLERTRELLQALGTEDRPKPGNRAAVAIRSSAEPAMPEQDDVENASAPADKSSVEGLLLIEGLKPGANLEG